MITTSLSLAFPATVVHRVTGSIDQAEAMQGAAAALGIVERLAREHAPLGLVLDLRDKHFTDLQAHRAWTQGFARNPALHGIIHAVAIVDEDTPAFRAEQELLTAERVQFFVQPAEALRWLATTREVSR